MLIIVGFCMKYSAHCFCLDSRGEDDAQASQGKAVLTRAATPIHKGFRVWHFRVYKWGLAFRVYGIGTFKLAPLDRPHPTP